MLSEEWRVPGGASQTHHLLGVLRTHPQLLNRMQQTLSRQDINEGQKVHTT